MARERKNYVKKPKKPFKYFLNKIFKLVFYILFALSIAFLIYLVEKSTLLKPNISWEIKGELQAQAYEYDELIKPLLINKYLLNLSQIKNKLEQSPWVSNVEVERIFWNRIRISLEKHDIAMRYGTEGYISSRGILFKPNLTINNLVRWNKISPSESLSIGKELVILRDNKNKTELAKITNTGIDINRDIFYTVKEGDNLSRIAQKYNVKIAEIRSWNDLNEEYILQPGDKLTITINVVNSNLS